MRAIPFPRGTYGLPAGGRSPGFRVDPPRLPADAVASPVAAPHAARAEGIPGHSGGTAPDSHRTSPTHRPLSVLRGDPIPGGRRAPSRAGRDREAARTTATKVGTRSARGFSPEASYPVVARRPQTGTVADPGPASGTLRRKRPIRWSPDDHKRGRCRPGAGTARVSLRFSPLSMPPFAAPQRSCRRRLNTDPLSPVEV